MQSCYSLVQKTWEEAQKDKMSNTWWCQKIPKSQSCGITCGKVPPCNACISATWQPQSFGGKQCRKASAGQPLLWKSRIYISIFKNDLGSRIIPNKSHFWNSFTRLCRKSEQKAGVWRLLQPFPRKNHVPASAELVQYAWPQFSFLGPIEVLDTLDIEKVFRSLPRL